MAGSQVMRGEKDSRESEGTGSRRSVGWEEVVQVGEAMGWRARPLAPELQEAHRTRLVKQLGLGSGCIRRGPSIWSKQLQQLQVKTGKRGKNQVSSPIYEGPMYNRRVVLLLRHKPQSIVADPIVRSVSVLVLEVPKILGVPIVADVLAVVVLMTEGAVLALAPAPAKR